MSNDTGLFSDLHKDATGFRPSPRECQAFLNMDEAEQAEYMDDLAKQVEESIEREREERNDAWLNFQDMMNKVVNEFGVDFFTAVRWDMDADDVDRTEKQDVEQYFWTWGLGFDKIDELTPQFMKRAED